MSSLQGLTVALAALVLARAMWMHRYPDKRRALAAVVGIALVVAAVVCGVLLIGSGAVLPLVGRELSVAFVLLLGAMCLGAELRLIVRGRIGSLRGS